MRLLPMDNLLFVKESRGYRNLGNVTANLLLGELHVLEMVAQVTAHHQVQCHVQVLIVLCGCDYELFPDVWPRFGAVLPETRSAN